MMRDRDDGMRRMLADIEAEVAYTRRMIGRDALDPRVMDAMARVPREAFVPDDLRAAAFDNGPLPIGHGQTISQPYIVALMTDLLAVKSDDRVLEVGTGSGYQTAVLSLLCQRVYTMDLISALADTAARRLIRLGYGNVEVRSGNGYEGWPEHAPYDGVIVTAAATHIPGALVEQLKPGGRLVVPVGLPYMQQELMLVRKDEAGATEASDVLPVAFVPLVDTSGDR
jgi:protein-L-isoaspartate(D-aspartate) O-methyltransferase